MSELFTAEEIEATTVAPSLRVDWYVILAQGFDGAWSLRFNRQCDIFQDLNEARMEAKKLSRRWVHYRIVRIPGEGGGK